MATLNSKPELALYKPVYERAELKQHILRHTDGHKAA